jgi:hypothetical protein
MRPHWVSGGVMSKIAVVTFFAILLCAGLGVYRDYGAHWDEDNNRAFGVGTLEYVLEGKRSAWVFGETHGRIHGPAFEVFLILVQRAAGIRDIADAIFMRHLMNYLLFCIGVLFFHLICVRLIKSRWMGLLGCSFLVLSPRIFGHAFYNTVDSAYMSLFIVAIYTMMRFLDERTFMTAAAHALASAVLIDVKVIGIFIPATTALMLFFRGDGGGRRMHVYSAYWPVLAYFILCAVLTVSFWPYLWESPIARFMNSLQGTTTFSPPQSTFIACIYRQGGFAPWYYLPLWIAITTPPLYLILFAWGLREMAHRLAYRGTIWKFRDEVIVVVWLMMQVEASMLSGVGSYNDWRHYHFAYPALVIIALYGYSGIWQRIKMLRHGKSLSAALVGITLLSLALTAHQMSRYHPYEAIYFNSLAGGSLDEAAKCYDAGDWGLSYRKGFEFLSRHQPTGKIKVYVATPPGYVNANMLPQGERQRIVFTNESDARYILCDLGNDIRRLAAYEVFAVQVDGRKISGVYEMAGA